MTETTRPRVTQTRPGTPMIGPYSTNQMDDFYAAFAAGIIKPSGLMNCVQHLFVARRCRPGDMVIDVCCGRGLSLPLLYQYAPEIRSYTGLDISPANLAEARQRDLELRGLHADRFSTRFKECDVAQDWPAGTNVANVVIYTAALEHLPKKEGASSLRHAANALAPDGTLYLSTPITTGPEPKLLQYGVHVYEWDGTELRTTLDDCGLEVIDEIGLLPPEDELVDQALHQRFGSGAQMWLTRLRETLPGAVVDVVIAAALPDLAKEVMFVCQRRS